MKPSLPDSTGMELKELEGEGEGEGDGFEY